MTTTIATGTQVRYLGSITQVHGLYVVTGTCVCSSCERDGDMWDIVARNHQAHPRMFPAAGPAPVRYVLEPAGDDLSHRLDHVRPESVAVVEAE